MIAIAGEYVEREGMELPDDTFCRGLRTELAAVHRLTCGLALAGAKAVRQLQTDASPLNQHEMAVGIMDLDGEKWCGAGAYELSGQTAKAEAEAMSQRIHSIKKSRPGTDL